MFSRSGYTGANCELLTDECAYDPPVCLNSGICKKDGYGFTCYCGNNEGNFYLGTHEMTGFLQKNGKPGKQKWSWNMTKGHGTMCSVMEFTHDFAARFNLITFKPVSLSPKLV